MWGRGIGLTLERIVLRSERSIVERGPEMGRTKVSSRYQIVIAKDVRRTADIRVGQQFQVIGTAGQITLVPDNPIASMRSFVRGIKTTGFRKKKDRI